MKTFSESQLRQIKEIFGVLQSARLNIMPVSNGWNIRVIKPSIIKPEYRKTFAQILVEAGQDQYTCVKCGTKTYCHPHHIIPKSAGGQDDPDNGLFLCFDHHVGNMAIHDGKWNITELISYEKILELKRRYDIDEE